MFRLIRTLPSPAFTTSLGVGGAPPGWAGTRRLLHLRRLTMSTFLSRAWNCRRNRGAYSQPSTCPASWCCVDVAQGYRVESPNIFILHRWIL